MKIIIVGAGKVGDTITNHLSKEGHDIIIIDQNPKAVNRLVDLYDVIGICGNGSNYNVLLEAQADKADLMISVSSQDESNILSCLMAKRMGTENVIARVRNPDYANQIGFMRKEFGFNLLINPELEAADEIVRMLMFPSVVKIDTFSDGKVDFAEIKITEKHTKLDGLILADLFKKSHVNVLICAVQRDGDIIIPDGNFVLKCGDRIHITATHQNLAKFCYYIGAYKNKVKNVMIVGGGKIAYYLTQKLNKFDMNVKIIESNHETCLELSDKLDNAIVIEGDGTDQVVLEEEGIYSMDAFISLTGIDEENIIVSLFASNCNVNKVVTKVNRMSFVNMIDSLGIESVVSPKNVISSRIIGYVRSMQNQDDSSQVETLYKTVHGKLEAIELVVNENANFVIGKSLKELPLKKDLLIAGIYRDNQLIVPNGDDVIKAGDHIMFVTKNLIIKNLKDILD